MSNALPCLNRTADVLSNVRILYKRIKTPSVIQCVRHLATEMARMAARIT